MENSGESYKVTEEDTQKAEEFLDDNNFPNNPSVAGETRLRELTNARESALKKSEVVLDRDSFEGDVDKMMDRLTSLRAKMLSGQVFGDLGSWGERSSALAESEVASKEERKLEPITIEKLIQGLDSGINYNQEFIAKMDKVIFGEFERIYVEGKKESILKKERDEAVQREQILDAARKGGSAELREALVMIRDEYKKHIW